MLKILNHPIVRLQKLLRIYRKRKELYHGSAYFSISNTFMEYLLEREDVIIKMYRYTLGADEVWMQSEIISSPFYDKIYKKEKAWGNLRYIDWERRRGNSPYAFKMNDYNELIQIFNTRYLFARKFNEKEDKQIINKIYRILYNE